MVFEGEIFCLIQILGLYAEVSGVPGTLCVKLMQCEVSRKQIRNANLDMSTQNILCELDHIMVRLKLSTH